MSSSGQIAERPSGRQHHAHHVQRGAETIAGEQVVGEDDVARLLAAEGDSRGGPSRPSRTCRRPGSARVRCPRAQRDLEPDVAHDGRDDRVAAEPTFAPSAACAQMSSTASPSTTRPRSSTKIARSPSPSNATPNAETPFDDERRQALRMRRAALEVDVAAVRLVADGRDVEAELAEQRAAPPSSSRRWRSRAPMREAPQPPRVGQTMRARCST